MIEIYSVLIFIIFVVIIVIRASILRKNGIKVIVFGKTDKSDFFLIPFVLILIYTIFASAFDLPLPMFLDIDISDEILDCLGIGLTLIATGGLIYSLVSFKESFRIGIDDSNSGSLIKKGAFGFSRNPLYVCFDLFLFGEVLLITNILIVLCSLFFVVIIHRQILREEVFLMKHYGEEYLLYCEKVNRYL